MQEELNLASLGNRVVNAIIDMITYLVIWFILSIGLVILGFNQIYIDETGETFPIIPFVIFFPVFWVYYILTEFFFQRTLGKLITKTKVVSLTGNKPTIVQIIFRTLSRNIPFEYLSYLFTVKGIHDRFSKTRVVKIK